MCFEITLKTHTNTGELMACHSIPPAAMHGNPSLTTNRSLHPARKADQRPIELAKIRNAEAVKARDAQIENLALRVKEREDRIVKLIEQRDNGYGPKRSSMQRRVGSPAQSRGSSPNLAALRSRGDV